MADPARPRVDGNRLVPFIGIGKLWVDIEYHAAEREPLVADDLSDLATEVLLMIARDGR